MTKAERRKRAREKKRTALREGGVLPAPEASPEAVRELLTEPLLEPAASVARVDSGYITGPIAPRLPTLPMPRRSALVVAPAAPVDSAVGEGDESEGDEPEGVELEGDGEDEDEDGAEGEDDEEGDGEPLDEEDALFNLACAAVEEGDALTWNELVTWLLAAEVDDPRLALLAALLVTEEDTSEVPKLTGARVLEALQQIDLADMVAEARETVANAPPEEGESEEERQLVRTSARELGEKAKLDLATPKRADKPVKASQLRSSAQATRTSR